MSRIWGFLEWCLLLFLVGAAVGATLLGCSGQSPAAVQNEAAGAARTFGSSLSYFRDERTGLCFADLDRPHRDYQYHFYAFTEVPCTSAVEALIPRFAPPEAN